MEKNTQMPTADIKGCKLPVYLGQLLEPVVLYTYYKDNKDGDDSHTIRRAQGIHVHAYAQTFPATGVTGTSIASSLTLDAADLPELPLDEHKTENNTQDNDKEDSVAEPSPLQVSGTTSQAEREYNS